MKKKYAYYVFMDEDIGISNITQFEAYLLKYMPPVGVPAGIAQLYGVVHPNASAFLDVFFVPAIFGCCITSSQVLCSSNE